MLLIKWKEPWSYGQLWRSHHEKKDPLSLGLPYLSYAHSHNLFDTIINKKIFLLFMILFFYKK